MGGLHDFHVRLRAHDPAREVNRSELRFGMTWGHVNDEAFAFAVGYSFELFGEELVVFAFEEAVPYIFDVMDEAFLSFAAGI